MNSVATRTDEYVLTYAVLRRNPKAKGLPEFFNWVFSENWNRFIELQPDGSYIAGYDSKYEGWKYKVILSSSTEFDGWLADYESVILIECDVATEPFSFLYAWDVIVGLLVDDDDKRQSDFWIAQNDTNRKSLTAFTMRQINGVEGCFLTYEEFDRFTD